MLPSVLLAATCISLIYHVSGRSTAQQPFGAAEPELMTPDDFASALAITGLKLSSDASLVAYAVGPRYNEKSQAISSLYLAKTAVEGSAKQITFGLHADYSPAFIGSTYDLLFLSDCHNPGHASQIYRLSALNPEAEPTPVTPTTNAKPILAFSISPDGKFVAFTSEDEEKSPSSDEIVYGEKVNLARLRIIELAKVHEGIRTIVSDDRHVDSFTWSADSSRILYRLKELPDMESNFVPVQEKVISVLETLGASSEVLEHDRLPGSPSVWTARGDIFFLQPYNPIGLSLSKSLWVLHDSKARPRHVAYGETNDANAIVQLGVDSLVAVEVASGLDTQIDIIDSKLHRFTAFATKEDAITFMRWDMKLSEDKYACVCVKSSGIRGEFEEVWFGQTERGKLGRFTTRLSTHHEWLIHKQIPKSKAFYWTASDGVKLEGIITYPWNAAVSRNLPTIVVPHGGPDWRDVYELQLGYWLWRPFLASQGYVVLSPNYRGSIGRGGVFSQASRGRLGTVDWNDIETMIDAAASAKIIDPKQLGLGGWSNGGFLSAWGLTRPEQRFKAGAIGAGVTDWASLVMQSEIPDLLVDLSGGAPWLPNSTSYSNSSPIHDVRNVQAPILMIHGQEDRRVPIIQAIGFIRGMLRERKSAPIPELVIYPREGHIFQERTHAVNVLKRVLAHFDSYMK